MQERLSSTPQTPRVAPGDLITADLVNSILSRLDSLEQSNQSSGPMLQSGSITAGGNGINGSITVNDSTGQPAVLIQGDPGAAYALDAHSGSTATLHSNNTGAGVNHAAILAESPQGVAVHAVSSGDRGILAQSDSGISVHAVSGGASPSNIPIYPIAVFAEGGRGYGIYATSTGEAAVYAESKSPDTYAVSVVSQGPGIAVRGATGVTAQGNPSGDFTGPFHIEGDLTLSGSPGAQAGSGWQGNLAVSGSITKGSSAFKIDHPLDPARKYLVHAAVESPDMKNIYDGVAALDANGEAIIELPAWFEALNMDFRYQLTCIGGHAPVYIAQKVHEKRFKIAGGQPGMEVSWQITGIRQDAWARANRAPVEEDKPADEQGYYLHPEVHGESAEKSIHRVLYPTVTSPVAAGSPAPGN